MEFIQTYWLELSVGVLFLLGVIIYIAWLIKKNGLRGAVVNLIVKAEDMYNKGDNEGKINYVIDKVIALIPVPFSLFITRQGIRDLIQKIFNEVKEALDYKK